MNYLPPGHTSSDTCLFPIGFHVTITSGKVGYLITETKFDRNFPLDDSRNIEESFSFYEKNWEKIVSVSKKFPENLKKIVCFRASAFESQCCCARKVCPFAC